MKRPALAVIFLAIGIFILLEGSSLSGSSIEIDLAMLVVGIILTISYLPLIGNYFELKFKAKTSMTYMPILVILGAVLIWQAGFRVLSLLDKSIFAAIGAALLVVSLFFIYKAKKSR
ncbi:MAG: hypothetical protein ABH852_05180 [Methanobacteriota archaeon]